MSLHPTSHRWLAMLVLSLGVVTARAAELRIPAFTAYTLPDAEGARISQRNGITRWTNPQFGRPRRPCSSAER